MYGLKIPITDDGLHIYPTQWLCEHCKIDMGRIKRKLCDDCSTMKKRKEQHAENQEILGIEWICAPCKKVGAW